jgi:acetyl-CoA carboxylase carboxyltransferase component
MTRVVLFGDPTKALGTVAEPECARVVAALDLAEERGIPVEWFALSSGARISMDSGTENMDWVARALRRIIEFTQAGGEINVVVAGINVGAQPYWNAEATMLMHTKGILVMTPDSAMVLTGKHSLDYSGGVSAEDNFGIGGYDRVMGPNGQAQYWAPNLTAACELLLPALRARLRRAGERWARPADTGRPARPRRARVPARAPGERLHHRRRHLLRDGQPRAEEAVRHPHGHARGHRPGPPGAGAVGRHGRRRHVRRLRRPPRRPPGRR